MDDEKGNYSAVPHEMSAVFMRLDLTARENRIVWFLIREIIGYQLKEKVIKTSKFVDGTGIYKQNLHPALKSLLVKNVIQREPFQGEQGEYVYRFSEDLFGRVHATSRVRVDPKTKSKIENASHQVNDSDDTDSVTSDSERVIKSMTRESSSQLPASHQVNDSRVIDLMTPNPWDAAPSAATLAPKDSIKDIKNILKIETKTDQNDQHKTIEKLKIQRQWLEETKENGMLFDQWILEKHRHEHSTH